MLASDDLFSEIIFLGFLSLSLKIDHKLCGIHTFKSLQSRSPPDVEDWEELEVEVVKFESQPLDEELLLPCMLLLLGEVGDEVEELIEEEVDRVVPDRDIVRLIEKDS